MTAMCMVAFGVGWAFAQTNTIKHTVDRGETLQSIAKCYATTEAKIIELNPDAAQFVYVGMELVIPAVEVNNAMKVDNQETLHNNIITPNNYSKTSIDKDFNDYSSPRWSYVLNVAYGFVPKPKGGDVSGSSFSFSMSVGANYYINNSLYVGARIGYGMSNINMSIHSGVAQYQNIINDTHMVILPVEVGYKLHLNEDKIMLTPYAGVDVNCVVKCTKESGLGSNKEKVSVDPPKRFGVNGRLGLRMNLYGFCLGGAYVFSFDDNYGDNSGFPEISIGFEF